MTVGAHKTNFRANQNMKWKLEIPSQLIEGRKNKESNLIFKYNELSRNILNIVNELKEQGAIQEEMRVKIQCILHNSSLGAKGEGQSSKTLRDFYGIGIFSCREFVCGLLFYLPTPKISCAILFFFLPLKQFGTTFIF